MSIIKDPLLFVGSKGEKILYTLFDSGANLSCINQILFDNLAFVTSKCVERKIETTNNGSFEAVKSVVLLDFYLDNVLLSDEFFVVPNLKVDCVIGAPTLRKWRIKLDFERNKAIVDPKVAKMQLI